MTPVPVGHQCPACIGRMRDDAAGRAAYRARTTVERRTARWPVAVMLRGASATRAIIGINIGVMLAMFLTGRPTAPDVLLRFGALPPVLPGDQWWRMITAMFVHVGLLHLLFNSWALLLFGHALEERYGRGRFLTLYLASGALGSAFSLAFTEGGIRAGASGGVFGILGAWLAFYFLHRDIPALRGQLRSVLFLIGINLFFGASVRGVDNFAHLGGLAGGLVIGLALELSVRTSRSARRTIWLGALAAAIAVAWVLASSHTI